MPTKSDYYMLIFFHIIIYNLFLFLNIKSYIVLPLNVINPNNDLDTLDNITPENFINKYIFTQTHTSLQIGNPPQILIINIHTEQYLTYLHEGNCIGEITSDFYCSKSNTCTFFNCTYMDGPYVTLRYNIADDFSVYNTIKLDSNITLKNFTIRYNNPTKNAERTKDLCAFIGLSKNPADSHYNEKEDFFIKLLKSKQLIGNYKFTIKYFKNKEEREAFSKKYSKKYENYDGALIIGNGINLFFNNKFKEENYKTINNPKDTSSVGWQLKFSSSFYNFENDKDNNKDNEKGFNFNEEQYATLNIKYRFIHSKYEYFRSINETFFNSYYKSNQCHIEKIQNFYTIYCDKDTFKLKERKKFPILYFKCPDLEYIFELTYEDVFMEIGDKVFFLIILEEYNAFQWTFGSLFLKKYQFDFDFDKGIVGFNIENEDNIYGYNKPNNKFLKFFIIFVFLLLGVLIGLIIGRKYLNKNKIKKQRANELLDQNYVYDSTNYNKINSDNNGGIMSYNNKNINKINKLYDITQIN